MNNSSYYNLLKTALGVENYNWKVKITALIDKTGLLQYRIIRSLFSITDENIVKINCIFTQNQSSNFLLNKDLWQDMCKRWKISSPVSSHQVSQVFSHVIPPSSSQVMLPSSSSDNKLLTSFEIDLTAIEQNNEKLWPILKKTIEDPTITEWKIKGSSLNLSRSLVQHLLLTQEPSITSLKEALTLQFKESKTIILDGFTKHLLIEESKYFKTLLNSSYKERQLLSVDLSDNVEHELFANLINYALNQPLQTPEISNLDLIKEANYFQMPNVLKNLEKQFIEELEQQPLDEDDLLTLRTS